MRCVRILGRMVLVAGLLTASMSGTMRAQSGTLLDSRGYFGCFTAPGFTNDCLMFTGSLFADPLTSSGTRFYATAVGGTIITNHGMLAPNFWLDLSDVRTNYATAENQGDNRWNVDIGPATTQQDGARGATRDPASIGFSFRAFNCEAFGFATSFCANGDPVVVVGGATLTVSVTPEPSTMWLTATGLAGLVGMVRRRRHRLSPP
jgi:hypothetical protein